MLGVQSGGDTDAFVGVLVLALGTALTLLGLGVVQAAARRAFVELDRGRRISPARAYQLAADSLRPLAGALVIAA